MESKLIPCDDRTCKCSDSYGICRADEPCRKPPMTTSEPTTGEIVEKLRQFATAWAKQKIIDDRDILLLADRLESLEQKLELLNGGDFDVIDIPAALAYLESVEEILPHASALIDLIQSLKGTAIELTARAEQAEKERDEVEKSLARRIMQHLSDYEFDSTFVCEICEYNLTNSPKCLSCGSDHHHGKNFELKHILRGQPQDCN